MPDLMRDSVLAMPGKGDAIPAGVILAACKPAPADARRYRLRLTAGRRSAE